MSKVIFETISTRQLNNEQIGLRTSWKLAKGILSEQNVVEPELSELVTLMRILKQLERNSTKRKEVEYAAAIAFYQQITGKPTNTELTTLKRWIECVGANLATK